MKETIFSTSIFENDDVSLKKCFWRDEGQNLFKKNAQYSQERLVILPIKKNVFI
jgi:hypothetical protein